MKREYLERDALGRITALRETIDGGTPRGTGPTTRRDGEDTAADNV